MATGPERSYQQALTAAIKAELGGRGWSRRHLAELTGITEQTLERVMNLKRDMSVIQLEQIADALGVTVDYLTTEARRWRERQSGDTSTPPIPAQPDPVNTLDGRAMLVRFLETPDSDPVLLARLSETANISGLPASEVAELQNVKRSLRRQELERAIKLIDSQKAGVRRNGTNGH